MCDGKGGYYVEETYLGCQKCNSSGYISCNVCARGVSGPGCTVCRDDPFGIKCRDCGGTGHKKPGNVWKKCLICKGRSRSSPINTNYNPQIGGPGITIQPESCVLF